MNSRTPNWVSYGEAGFCLSRTHRPLWRNKELKVSSKVKRSTEIRVRWPVCSNRLKVTRSDLFSKTSRMGICGPHLILGLNVFNENFKLKCILPWEKLKFTFSEKSTIWVKNVQTYIYESMRQIRLTFNFFESYEKGSHGLMSIWTTSVAMVQFVLYVKLNFKADRK